MEYNFSFSIFFCNLVKKLASGDLGNTLSHCMLTAVATTGGAKSLSPLIFDLWVALQIMHQRSRMKNTVICTTLTIFRKFPISIFSKMLDAFICWANLSSCVCLQKYCHLNAYQQRNQ